MSDTSSPIPTQRHEVSTAPGALWSREFVWTNTSVNMCFLTLLVLLQINALVMMHRLDYAPFSSGLIIFLLSAVAEFCLVLQPPGLMKWIPFWNNAFGRGLVLSIMSVMALSGVFFMGVVALCGSIVTMCSPICSGSFEVPPPFLSYEKLFVSRGGRVYERIPETA